jgi:hypothetical protein
MQFTVKNSNVLPPPLLLQHPRKGSATGRTSEGRETVSLTVINGVIHPQPATVLYNTLDTADQNHNNMTLSDMQHLLEEKS